MDTETMVGGQLTLIMIDEGKNLVRVLDESGGLIDAAFWFLYPAPEQWKLVLSLPRLADAGPKASYAAIQRGLAKLDKPQINLTDIRVARPDSALPGSIRESIKTGSSRMVRLTNQVVDGQLIEDAYIYRL